MKRIIFFLPFLFIGNLYARYLNKSDFTYITQVHHNKIIVHNDGSHQIKTKLKLKIVKEEARKKLGIYPIIYNAASSKIENLNAFVSNGKNKYKVSKKNIVDVKIAKNSYGFDSSNLIKIALPNLKIGSIIEIEYVKKTTKGILNNHFSMLFPFGIEEYREKSNIEIISDKKIHYDINDPWKVLKVESKKNKEGKHVYSIRQRRPFGNLSALQSLQLMMKKLTFIVVSTDKDWNVAMKDIKLAYEKIINGSLPFTLNKIAKGTLKKVNLKDKAMVLR